MRQPQQTGDAHGPRAGRRRASPGSSARRNKAAIDKDDTAVRQAQRRQDLKPGLPPPGEAAPRYISLSLRNTPSAITGWNSRRLACQRLRQRTGAACTAAWRSAISLVFHSSRSNCQVPSDRQTRVTRASGRGREQLRAAAAAHASGGWRRMRCRYCRAISAALSGRSIAIAPPRISGVHSAM